ncbi:hypothetical protein FOL47_007883 [Perkinsus chesapeaki]|uniref:Telomerase reverse transcriptase n=1 Tax=Perkinsus chesapeaki TaxID=330153 RepID=A0A7J6LIG4_PERCH|nr:hypothetical protein FOL47_007883 [Perkinsus chesapeaki]
MSESTVTHDSEELLRRIHQAGLSPSKDVWQSTVLETCRVMTLAFGTDLAFELIGGANACFVLVQPDPNSPSVIALFGNLKSLPAQIKRSACPPPIAESRAKPDRMLDWSAVLYSSTVYQRGNKMPPVKRARLTNQNSESLGSQDLSSSFGECDLMRLFPRVLTSRDDFADLPLGSVKQFLSDVNSGLRNRALELLGNWQSDGRFKGLKDTFVFQEIKAIDEFEVEPHAAARIAVQLIAEAMPQGLLGSAKNRQIVLRNIRKCYSLRAGETIGLRSLTSGMRTRMLPVSQRTAQMYLSEMVWFIFDRLVLPITRLCFYVTEVQDKRVAGRLHYFYKPDWSALCARAARGYVAHVGLKRVEDGIVDRTGDSNPSSGNKLSRSASSSSSNSLQSDAGSSRSGSVRSSPKELSQLSSAEPTLTRYGLSLMPIRHHPKCSTLAVRKIIHKDGRPRHNSCGVRWIPKTKGGMRPIAQPPRSYQSSGRVCHRELIRPIKFSGALGRSVLDRDQRAGELEEFLRKHPGDSIHVGVYDLKNCYENINHKDILAALHRLEQPVESLKVIRLFKGHPITQEVGLSTWSPHRVTLLLPKTLTRVALRSVTVDRVKNILNNVELILPHGRYTFDGKGLVQGGTLSPVLCSLALGNSDPLADAPIFTARLVDDGLLVGSKDSVSKALEVVKGRWTGVHKTATAESGESASWAGFVISPNDRWLNFSCRPESSGASSRAGCTTRSISSWVDRSLKRSLGHRMTTTLLSHTLNEKSTVRRNIRAAQRMAAAKLRSTVARRHKIHKLRTSLKEVNEARARLTLYIEYRMRASQKLS